MNDRECSEQIVHPKNHRLPSQTLPSEGKQGPERLILSVTIHIICSVATLSILQHVPLSGHDDIAILNDVANDAELTQKIIIRSYSLV